MLSFDFLEEELGIVSPSYFVWFLKKNVSHVIFQKPNFIVWLPLVLQILGNMCTAIVCLPDCDIKILK